jgi:hypothetical protein
MNDFAMVSATGMLGSGFQEESLSKALALGARFIGCDAGSTDPGPVHMATGEAQFSREAVMRDTAAILTRAVPAGIPVIIGSAGTAGGDPHVNWQIDIVREVAARAGLHFRLGVIYAEQSKADLLSMLRRGCISALPPSEEMTEATIEEAVRIVAMMGPEPLQQAFLEGAQVVVAGRASDPAIFAALPLLEGFDPGIVWHAAKTLECGAAPVVKRVAPDSLMAVIRTDSFEVFPLRDDYRCTPQSIASHSLYENADPFRIHEPGGTLDTTNAQYVALSDRSVRVSGGRFFPADSYRVKLEGVRHAGYATSVIGGIRDPYILSELPAWLEGLSTSISIRLSQIPDVGHSYKIRTRVYGHNGVMGVLERSEFAGHEALIIWDVIATTQALAHAVAKSVTHLAIHHPIPKWKGLITGVAVPFSPPELDRGAVYEFCINHTVATETPSSLFPTKIMDI